MAPGAIYIGRGRFWSEIRWGKACTPPQENTRIKLHSHNRMWRKKIHWNYTRLGLQANTSAYFTTRLHKEDSQSVQPQIIEKERPTIPKCPYQLCRQKICHANIIGTTSWQKGKEIYSTSMWNFFVSRKSVRQHPSMINKRHRIPIREYNRGNNKTNTKTVILHRDTRRSHTNVQPKRHENHSPQRCELPDQNKRTKSSRRSLLFIQRNKNTTKKRCDS